MYSTENTETRLQKSNVFSGSLLKMNSLGFKVVIIHRTHFFANDHSDPFILILVKRSSMKAGIPESNVLHAQIS